MRFSTLLMIGCACAFGACERHSWEDVTDENGQVTEKGTKRLFDDHGHEEGTHEESGHDHAEEGGHDHDADGKADH